MLGDTRDSKSDAHKARKKERKRDKKERRKKKKKRRASSSSSSSSEASRNSEARPISEEADAAGPAVPQNFFEELKEKEEKEE